MAICCSVKTHKWSSILWFLVSAGCLGFTLFGFLGGQGIFIVPPDVAYVAALVLFSLWFIVSLSGALAALKHSEMFLVFFVIMGGLTILLTVFAFVYITLSTNDIATFAALDSAAGDAQNDAEIALFESIQENPENWIEVQTDFDCCGYDFLAVKSAFNASVTTGPRCFEESAQLATIGVPGGLCENDEDTDLCLPDGLRNGFFCKDALVDFFVEQTPVIASVMGVIVLVQIVAWFSALRLYWVPFTEGGYYDGAYGGEHYDGGLPTKADPNFQGALPPMGGPPQTSNFGNAVRNLGNRMSTRMGFGGAGGGNPFGAPPGGAPPSFGGGGGGGGPPGMPGQMPPPSMGGGGAGLGFGGAIKSFANRASMNFRGKPMFGAARPPPGPPPSLGGGGGSSNQLGSLGSFGGPPGGGPPPSSQSGSSFGKPKDDIPAPNSFGGGGSGGGFGGGGGGFGSKMKGFGNRVSMKMTGKPMFGQGRPPPSFGGGPPRGGPPPSFGGGGGGPPPSFGGGPPRGGPPSSFGGGGGPPQKNPPKKKGGFGFGVKKAGGKKGKSKPLNQVRGMPSQAVKAGLPPRGGLLAGIQKGGRLNHVSTHDRSGPEFQGRVL